MRNAFFPIYALLLPGVLSFSLLACGDKGGSSEDPGKENVGLQAEIDGASTDSLTIATLNLSVGWNAEDLVLKDLSDSDIVYHEMHNLYDQYLDSDAPRRMRVIAAILAEHPVDVLCLQETQVMQIGDTLDFHFVDTLLADMKALDSTQEWTVFRQEMNQITLAVDTVDSATGIELGSMDLNFWEGNAILVRSSLEVLGDTSAIYESWVNFQILGDTIGSHRGYQRALVRTPGGALWQIFNTHLEVEILPRNGTQGLELNEIAWNAWQGLDSGAQVLVGDLNSKTGTNGVGYLTNSTTGMLDAWEVVGQPDSSGYTCCLADFTDSTDTYDRRIDYVLGRNILDVSSVERVGLFHDGFWGSDHAMVRATLKQQL
ncbi:MAG TPA: endonuclease/exonuclease/phosphatase family protein [Fibrobacteraceae bacterium]|nr:endonuclease/exonuclease/phosphatase family protein [Fibrobacteraceae bacterium]